MTEMPKDPEKRRKFKKNLRDRKEKAHREALYVTAADGSNEETEKIAKAVLTPEESQRVAEEDGLTARALIRRKYGVDPSDYETDQDLLQALGEPEARESAEQNEAAREAEAQAAAGAKVSAAGSSGNGSEAVADAVLTPSEALRVEANDTLSAASLIRRKYDVEASAYANEQELLAAIGVAQSGE